MTQVEEKKYVVRHKNCDLYVVERRSGAARWAEKKEAIAQTKLEWETQLALDVREFIVLEEVDSDTQVPLDFSTKLTPAQTERLAVLAEECGELVQRVGKILRHGYSSTGYNNLEELELETGDVLAAISLLCDAGDISFREVNKRKVHKLDTIYDHLHHHKKP